MPVLGLSLFDIWQEGYGGATVNIYLAGTSTPASIFSDENLTVALGNPQVLASQTVNGVASGKWQQPVYTSAAVELLVNSIDRTGVIRPPITELDGEDVSETVATPEGGTEDTPLDEILGRVIYAEDYGAIGASAATNTTTMAAAITAASGRGGARVVFPAGDIVHNAVTLPGSCIIKGQGRGVTTFKCQVGAACWTLSGDRAGFEDCTLDGVNKVAGSIGVFSTGKDETYFSNVEVKNFETCVQGKGIERANWRDLYIDNCGTNGYGVHWRGDANSANGSRVAHNEWVGGLVTNCAGRGIFLDYFDRVVESNSIRDVGFENNTGTALYLRGAHNTRLDGCWWEGNTVDLFATDSNENGGESDDHKLVTLLVAHGTIDGGEIHLEGTCSDVTFQRMILDGALAIELDATLKFAITTLDCIEGGDVGISGVGTRWQRFKANNYGETFGITTDATATKAWSIYLEPGQVVACTGRVIGNQQNGPNTAEYFPAVSAKRAGATLAYDAQTGNFTVGDIITGGTSGATARIIADSDGGATGTLTVRDIDGAFIDNELITGSLGGSATANGSLSVPAVALLGTSDNLRTAREDVAGWNAAFVANGPELELRCTGAASTTIEWTVCVESTVG